MRRTITLALSLLGLFDSLYLLYTYTSPSRPMACLGTGCDAVRASAYSTFAGVSMPVFGVAGYALLALAIVAEALFSRRVARLTRYALLGMTGVGFLFSLYLEYLQVFVIHAFCAWCMTSGIVMTALVGLSAVGVLRAEPDPGPALQLAWLRRCFAVAVVALAVGVPAFYGLVRHYDATPAAPPAAEQNVAERLLRPGAHEAGNPQAALTVVEFGDFQCPVCGRGEAAAREIRARYANQVRFVFREFPLERIHPFAQKAAEAAECAGEQGKFWEMVEKIYSRQDELSLQGLERDAVETGLDRPRFNRCLESGSMAERVRQDVADGRALGVRATPTFFIGQQRIEGVLTAEQFAQLIDAQLAGAAVQTAAPPAPVAPPAGIAPKKPDTPPAKGSVPTSSAQAQPISSTAPASASSGRPPLGFAPSAPAGFGGGLPGAGTNPLLGTAPSGTACNEADAAKQQPAMIGTPELHRLLSGPDKPLLVDVRPAASFAAGRIPGAVNLPADDIARRWSTLPKDRTIVLYESGRASGDICAASRATGRTLLEHGFPFSRIKVYQDGLAGWEHASGAK